MGVKMIADKRRKPSRARMLVVQRERAVELDRIIAEELRRAVPLDIVTFRNGVRVN